MCCSTEYALSIEENLPLQNHLSVPDRTTHDVTPGATFVCKESTVFVLSNLNKIKFVWIGLVTFFLVNDLSTIWSLLHR